MGKPTIIGICGPAGSGKSTLADAIAPIPHWEIVPMAAPLKTALCNMGVPASSLFGSPLEKQSFISGFGGASGRELMRSLGDWGRSQYVNFWVDRWLDRVTRHHSTGVSVCCDDVRHANEAEAILDRGGVIVEVRRSGIDYGNDHATEQRIDDAYISLTISNDKAPAYMLAKLARRWHDLALTPQQTGFDFANA